MNYKYPYWGGDILYIYSKYLHSNGSLVNKKKREKETNKAQLMLD